MFISTGRPNGCSPKNAITISVSVSFEVILFDWQAKPRNNSSVLELYDRMSFHYILLTGNVELRGIHPLKHQGHQHHNFLAQI